MGTRATGMNSMRPSRASKTNRAATRTTHHPFIRNESEARRLITPWMNSRCLNFRSIVQLPWVITDVRETTLPERAWQIIRLRTRAGPGAVGVFSCQLASGCCRWNGILYQCDLRSIPRGHDFISNSSDYRLRLLPAAPFLPVNFQVKRKLPAAMQTARRQFGHREQAEFIGRHGPITSTECVAGPSLPGGVTRNKRHADIVARQCRIRGDERHPLHLCLHHQEPVERITMVWRQSRDPQRVRRRDRQPVDPARTHAFGDVNGRGLGQRQFPDRILDGDFPHAGRREVTLLRRVRETLQKVCREAAGFGLEPEPTVGVEKKFHVSCSMSGAPAQVRPSKARNRDSSSGASKSSGTTNRPSSTPNTGTLSRSLYRHETDHGPAGASNDDVLPGRRLPQ